MGYDYIEIDDIDHLFLQSNGGGVFDDPSWRESYYFNMTDMKSGVSLITTIGLLPNKKRKAGFILLMMDQKTILLRPQIVFERPSHSDCVFRAKNLEYTVQGVDWKIRYVSKNVKLDLVFKPLNKLFAYANGSPDDAAFEKIGTQHFEQSGTFFGKLFYNGKWIDIGPCFGHRDHSWGIRDWSSVDKYRLFCCTFSEDLAFNLWEGRMEGKDFLRGYVFDGEDNTEIVSCEVQTKYRSNGIEPRTAVVKLLDKKDRTFKVKCEVVSSHPFPPKGSILYETIAKMQMNGKVGHGLLEYLYHAPNPILRVPSVIGLLKEMMET